MKILLICCFIISPFWLKSQTQDSVQVAAKSQAILVGVDLFNPVYSAFTNKKGGEAMITVPVTEKWIAAAELGYDNNSFENNIWDVEASGIYGKIGANWMISQDLKDPNMGYYIGVRAAFSPYQQTIHKYLIQGNDIESVEGSIPKHSVSTVWLEPLTGGRVSVGNTNFYVDASIRLKVKIWDTNEYDITPLVIPGFGVNQNGLNFGVNWTIGYSIPFKPILKIKDSKE